MDENVNIRINSSPARADLAALAKSLDATTSAAKRMQSGLADGVNKSNAALQQGAKSLEKFAQVAALVSKVKLSGDPAKAVGEFARALGSLSRVKPVNDAALKGFLKFIEVGNQVSKLNFGANAFNGVLAFAQAMDSVARARAIRATTLKSYVDFIEVAARVQRLRFTPSTNAALTAFGAAMDGIARARSISPARLAAIKELFAVLGSAKGFPAAGRMAADLDRIAAAANRASAALQSIPQRVKATSFGGVAASADALNKKLRETPEHTARAHKGIVSLSSGLDGLRTRFNLTYQAGTIFSALFASFTLGQFVKGIYDANIQTQKLEKAMFFVTGSFDKAKAASKDFLAMSNSLGQRALANSDAFGRFAISSAAIGASLEDVQAIYRATGTALAAVGATGQQSEYAIYGLSQAMAKGKISSEEFNRQIGEQIPGNVAAGVKALSTLTGHTENAASFFDAMRKGSIQSLPFLREWAKELEASFGPLLAIAAKRPDFQLKRLLNVYDSFKVAVGNSAFIGELTLQMRKLSSAFLEGEPGAETLNKTALKLASSLGKGLADVVRTTGDAIRFAADHIQDIIAGLKVLLTLALGATFAKWATSAQLLADKMLKSAAATMAQSKALLTLKKSGDAVAASSFSERIATAAGGKSGVTQGGPLMLGHRTGMPVNDGRFNKTQAPRFAKMSGDLFGGPGMNIVPEFGRRAAGERRSFNAVREPILGSRMTSGFSAVSGSALKQGFATAGKGLLSLGALLPGIGTLAMAAAVALAVFGNNLSGLKSAAGNAVTYNDIIAGAFDEMGASFNAFVKTITLGAVDLGSDGGGFGKAVALVMSSIISLGKIFTVFGKLIGTTVGGALGDLFDMIITFGRASEKALHLDFKGAMDEFHSGSKRRAEGNAEISKQLGADIADAFDFKGNYERILAAGGNRADRRAESGRAAVDAADAAAQRDMEAARQQVLASEAQERAANTMNDATSAFRETIKPLRFNGPGGVMTAINDMLAGKTPAASPVAAAAVKPPVGFAMRGYDGSPHTYDATAANADAYFKALLPGVRITSGLRTPADQARIRAQGATPAANSMHLTNEARDLVLKDMSPASRKAAVADFKAKGFSEAIDEVNHIHVGWRGAKNVPFKAGATAPGAMMGGITDDSPKEESEISRQANRWKSLMTLTAVGSPAAAALADEQDWLEKLRDIQVAEQKLRETVPGAESVFGSPGVKEQLASAYKKLTQNIEEGLNPLAKEQRLLAQSNDVTTMRVQGLSEAADWQQRMNDLSEQGYDTSLMQDDAKWTAYLNKLKAEGRDIDVDRLRMKPAELAMETARTDNLQRQIDLTKTLNDLAVQRTARTGTAYDATLASLIAGAAKDGESLEQARARLSKPDSKGVVGMNLITQQAGAIEGGRREDVSARQKDALSEITATSRLSSGEAGRRNDYKQYLQELVGSTSDSLSFLEGQAKESDKAWAKYMADIKYNAEHPPGFQRWADSLEPLAERLNQIKAGFAESLSSALTDALMGDEVDWTKIAKDFTRQLIKARVDTSLQGLIQGFTGNGQQQAQGGPVAANGNAPAPGMWQKFKGLFQPQVAADGSKVGIMSKIGSLFAGGGGSPQGGSVGTAIHGLFEKQTKADGSKVGVLEKVGNLFGFGQGGEMSQVVNGSGPMGAVNPQAVNIAAQTVTINAQSVAGGGAGGSGGAGGASAGAPAPDTLNDMLAEQQKRESALTGGSTASGGGFMNGVGNFFGGAKDKIGSIFGGGTGSAAKAGAAQAGMAMTVLGGVNTLLDLFGVDPANTGPDYKGFKGESGPGWDKVNGIVGTMGGVDLSATQVAAKSNPIADALNFGLNLASGGAYGQYAGIGNMIGSTVSRFKDGGYTSSPASTMVMHPSVWANAPHYKNGTPNTSDGGMPAIVHPNEAVIPLSGGRSIPVEMNDGGGRTTNTTTTNVFNIQTPDADSFRQSQSSIQRKQNLAAKRASIRNLHAA